MHQLLQNTDWYEQLASEWNKPYWYQLVEYVENAYNAEQVYPAKDIIFAALTATPFRQTKVVILGQDPYHGKDQAHGLSFSVLENTPLPPSLRNMYKEMEDDIGCSPSTGNLSFWASQGVLLLNTVLTVQEGVAHSHAHFGWEKFTDEIIKVLNNRHEQVIFVLWGNHAKKKHMLIDSSRHIVITGAHPSPLSAYRGFFGSKPYSQINNHLIRIGNEPIHFCGTTFRDKVKECD